MTESRGDSYFPHNYSSTPTMNTDTIQLRAHYKIPLQDFYGVFRPLSFQVFFFFFAHPTIFCEYKTSSRFAYDIIIKKKGPAPMVARRHYVFYLFLFYIFYSMQLQLDCRESKNDYNIFIIRI